MQHKINWCYLCKSTENLTSDHIPPQNLFPKLNRVNLITVPCCKKCNEGFSKIDEQFRAFVSMAANVSETGTNIMREKVFGSSFKRSPKLKTQIGKGVLKGSMMTDLGTATVPLITMDNGVFEPFFIRLTKGLLATFYREINYFDLKFVVTQHNQFGSHHPSFQTATSMLVADERGGGIFKFWHGVAHEKPTSGVWIYQFYDAALFMVRHDSPLA